MEETDIDTELKKAELEHALLENAQLRKVAPWTQVLSAMVPIATSLIAVAGLLVGVHQFSASANATRQAEAAAREAEAESRRSEFKKRFWEERVAIYAEVTDLAAKIAISDDLTSVATERQRFWSLYWGRMSLLESKSVYQAMIAYGEDLHDQETGASASGLLQLSYMLARAARQSLRDTWEPVPLDDLPKERVSSDKDPHTKK